MEVAQTKPKWLFNICKSLFMLLWNNNQAPEFKSHPYCMQLGMSFSAKFCKRSSWIMLKGSWNGFLNFIIVVWGQLMKFAWSLHSKTSKWISNRLFSTLVLSQLKKRSVFASHTEDLEVNAHCCEWITVLHIIMSFNFLYFTYNQWKVIQRTWFIIRGL